MERLVDAYPEHVQYVYRHYPLNSIHANARKAAEASEAAGAQGAFWTYHDLLFERIADWSALGADDARDLFVALAEELGLDTERFATELDEGDYSDYIAALEQEAVNLGINSTPTAIVDGFVTGMPPEYAVWDNFVNGRVQLKLLEDRQYDAPPMMTIDPDTTYLARVEMETGGEFVVELLAKTAPQTVNSFVFLAREGWFDGVTFHRVIPGFVAQTGDPSGTGMGGPGYIIPNEVGAGLSHDGPGVVAMANSGPDTNGSQWYITYDNTSQLDGSYTIFGRVIEGMEVVESLTPRDLSQDPSLPPGDRIVRITIEEE
jgi:cyclophilin family peptidyl-prolyl cis-trans isomerase